MSEPRQHHSVPQFLLKGFARKKRRVWQTSVFDKRDGRIFLASVKDVMVERDFNAIEMKSGQVSLEKYISQFEDVAAPILRRLIAAETTSVLSKLDRRNLAVFVSLQLIRGTGQRAQYFDLATQLREKLLKDGLDADNPLIALPNRNTVKLQALHGIATYLQTYADHLCNKDMIIFRAPSCSEFIIGDNPVVMDNQKSFEFRGNLGLAVEGIEIYLPLTHKLTLGFWASDLISDLKEMVAQVRKKSAYAKVRAILGTKATRTIAKNAIAELNNGVSAAKILIREVQAGGPVYTHPESMDRFNSLQIGYAEQYLVSLTGNFDLAKHMIADRPEIALGGARGKVS